MAECPLWSDFGFLRLLVGPITGNKHFLARHFADVVAILDSVQPFTDCGEKVIRLKRGSPFKKPLSSVKFSKLEDRTRQTHTRSHRATCPAGPNGHGI